MYADELGNVGGPIVIAQVANGFMVRLPNQPIKSNGSDFFALPIRSEGAIRREARIMKDELTRDEELERIKNEYYRPEFVPISELKDDRVYVFKTFSEVLEFLNEKMNEK